MLKVIFSPILSLCRRSFIHRYKQQQESDHELLQAEGYFLTYITTVQQVYY